MVGGGLLAEVSASRSEEGGIPYETGSAVCSGMRTSPDLQSGLGHRFLELLGVYGAGNGIRTRDFNLGKVALYH